MKPLIPTLLATCLSLLVAGNAIATDGGEAADERELATARAELERAVKRYAELARSRRGQAGDLLRLAEEARSLAANAAVLTAFRDRPVLGVLLEGDDQPGVRIAGVTPGSGAGQAGLRSGDRLLSVDGQEILGSSGELRVANARRLLAGLREGKPVRISYLRDGRRASVEVTPRRDSRIAIFTGDAGGNVVVRTLPDGAIQIGSDSLTGLASPEAREKLRQAIDGEALLLASAFRWRGLHLASVDARLGRYFGTDRGVLVLSPGELAELEPGDVIQRVDGRAVSTPREVMDILRDRDEGERVSVDYLRDRKAAQARITIPKPAALPLPPAPPAPPPAPPKPPKPAATWEIPVPPSAPPAPPLPPAPDDIHATTILVAAMPPAGT